MLVAFLIWAATAQNGCTNDFIGFQPPEKVKYDSKGDKVTSGQRPNTRAVCFDLESKSEANRGGIENDSERDDEVGEATTCEICVGTPGHLRCKQGIENLMESGQRTMDCVENVDELNIEDIWVKMGPECTDALWIDALLVWADKWTCTNPSAKTSYKHTGKTFKPVAPKVDDTRVAFGKSNNYGWCLSNDPADATLWNKGSRQNRYRAQKVLGDTCYPVLRFTIEGGVPSVQGYASADLLEAAELEAMRALWLGQLPRGRRRSEIISSPEYRALQRKFRRRQADVIDEGGMTEFETATGSIEVDTEDP